MYRLIDLFAGIGGIRLGVNRAAQSIGLSCKTVFSSEIDRFAVQTYASNFGDTNISGDITKISPQDIPDHDILLAGFPCQAFSVAGHRLGFEDTRGTLFFNIKEILKIKKPQALLLENVKGLVRHNKGHTFSVILKELQNLGYSVHYKVLRATDFGLPQNRERVILVGFKDKNKAFCFPYPRNKQVTVGSILERKPPEKYTLSDKLWSGHQRRKAEHKKKGNGFGYGLFNAQSPYTNTISARYYKDGSEILIEGDPGQNPRKLTPKECARLQGFGDDFKIVVSDTQAYKQFGNAVPVNMIEDVAKNLLLSLENKLEPSKENKENKEKYTQQQLPV